MFDFPFFIKQTDKTLVSYRDAQEKATELFRMVEYCEKPEERDAATMALCMKLVTLSEIASRGRT